METGAEKTKEYRALLPQRIKVSVESSEDGLWATISTEDGSLKHCYTQAANATELVTMVNDAVLTHYEIPEEFQGKVGFYSPMTQ